MASTSPASGTPILDDDARALQPIVDVPGLPRVLLIGDSISMGYTVTVREALKGQANVHRPPLNCRSTAFALGLIDEWLGSASWQLIHFNWGLHDLARMEADKRSVPPDQYEKNLRTLLGRLRATGASLIWASTTPVPENAGGRLPSDAIEYNAIAAGLMQEYSIPTDDLYAFALPQLEEIQRPANVHFHPHGYQILGAQVAAVIGNALPSRS